MRLVIFLAFALSCANSQVIAQDFPNQKVHREDFQVSSDAVFEVIRMFYDYDVSYPLNARIAERENDSDRITEKIVISASNDDRIPFLLIRPESTSSSPAVILINGLGNSKERWLEKDRNDLIARLLAEGNSVVIPDLQYHGERAFGNDHVSPVFLTFGDSLFTRSRNMVIQSTIDVRRVIDYLHTRDDIDTRRLGVVGYSMGAMIGVYLSVLEPDIVSVVACAIPTTTQPLPRDHFQFAPRALSPVHLIVGKSDWLSSPDDIDLLLGLLPDGSTSTFLDAGHSLPPSFIDSAFNFLNAAL